MGLDLNYAYGQTPLGEDEKEGLKISSINTQGELDEFEQFNIEKALEWSIRTNFKPERILTEKFILDLHKKMFGEVWKWAGKFRRSDKNLGVEWTKIGVELRKLIDDANFWIQDGQMSAEEIAIRFKHRIVSIHCFPNGNGRHSRLMADIIMETIFDKEAFSWHQSNMVNSDNSRKEYIRALRQADRGDIRPLIEFATS
jgi:Fic-DOC domain mobile mystery protein B